MEKGGKNMTNVSSRARTVEQPRGGYINPKIMERVQFEDGITLNPESVAPVTMGMIVDYLTRIRPADHPIYAVLFSPLHLVTERRDCVNFQPFHIYKYKSTGNRKGMLQT